ncbi:hypothetical protein BDR07DRAFT_1373069 [Suillus spraguei]|nr:hypothetical protein BDR07DRAFT_1373069 [Suillus spraguei]
MLNALYLHEVHVVNWPTGVSPVSPDFVFKDSKTDELKALVGPYLKCCMGTNYNAELTHVEHQELKKKKKDKSHGSKVPDKELMFVPWSDGKNNPACIIELVTQTLTESKELSVNEDPEMLNIPLITDMEGGVIHTLMDCVLFMKNLPASIELPDATTPHRNSPTPQPLSSYAWSPSPPHHKHHLVSQALPRTITTRMIPHQTRQPVSQQGKDLHPQGTSRLSHAVPMLPGKSSKLPAIPPVRKCR